jgi:CRISPR-associated protein Cas1
MGVLYIDRKGTELRLTGGALEIRDDRGQLRSVPARLLERVVLRADTRLSSATLAGLGDLGVGILALGGRSGERVSQMLGQPTNDVRVRVAQYKRLDDTAFAVGWVRRTLRAKLMAQRRVLARACSRRPDIRKPLHDAVSTITQCLDRLGSMDDISALRGLEGGAAAAYWRGFAAVLPDSSGFPGRRRRPPPDPVNATLSLGYTLLQSQAVQACWVTGLDPMIGYLHPPAWGRASLACDLMEPWRPQVDQWVLELFRTRALRLEHFATEGSGACLLGKAGRAHFYEAWGQVQARMQGALRRYARLAARSVVMGIELPQFSLETDEAIESAEEA